MSNNKARFTTPVGRLLQGSVDEPQTKDMQGRPRVVKSGPNAGQPNPQYYIGVAFAKNDPAWPAFHSAIYQKAAEDFPALFPNAARGDLTCIRPDFAFKIIDGDSTGYSQSTPPKRWCDYENFPGHWVVRFASAYPPRCFYSGRYAPNEQIQEKNVIRRGYFVRVSGSMEGNGDQQKPGMYLNLDMVELSGYGPEIQSGPDAGAAFGSGPAALPAGATTAPITPPAGAASPPAPGAPPAPPAPPAPSLPPAPAGPPRPTDPTHIHAAGTADEMWWVNGAWVKAAAPIAPPAPPAPPPVAPTPAPPPYTGYMAPGPGPIPPAGPVPPASAPTLPPPPLSPAPLAPSSGPVMTAAANGATYEQMIAAGWTDDTLRAHGMMQ